MTTTATAAAAIATAPAGRDDDDAVLTPDTGLAVVVVAAGRSSRMGGTDKTFAAIHGVPLIVHTLTRLASCAAVSRIVLVVAEESVARAAGLARRHSIGKIAAVCAGGPRRQDSVLAGLAALGPCRWVAVHDGARPCVSPDLMARALAAAQLWGAAVAAVPVKDTIKVVAADGVITATPERATLWAAQTPQVFDYHRLLAAHCAAAAEYTDDAALMAAAGHTVRVFPGAYENLKVTTPDDLALASHLLAPDPPPAGALSGTL